MIIGYFFFLNSKTWTWNFWSLLKASPCNTTTLHSSAFSPTSSIDTERWLDINREMLKCPKGTEFLRLQDLVITTVKKQEKALGGSFTAAEYMFKRVRSGHDEKLLEPNNFAHNTFFLSFFQQGKVQQSAVRLQRDSSSCQYEQGLPTWKKGVLLFKVLWLIQVSRCQVLKIAPWNQAMLSMSPKAEFHKELYVLIKYFIVYAFRG